MSLTNLQCNKCGKKYSIPRGITPWRLQCHYCKTTIELDVNSQVSYLNPMDGTRSTSKYEKKSGSDIIGGFLEKFLLYSIPVGCLLALVMYVVDLNNDQTQVQEHLQLDTPSMAIPVINQISNQGTNQNTQIYSGTCILYKKTLLPPNKIKYTAISKSYGKVVINRSIKQFSFFYNGKLIFSRKNFDNYQDGQNGGEGFTFSGELSAYRLIAERKLTIVDEAGSYGSKDSFMGYEYEIINYKTD